MEVVDEATSLRTRDVALNRGVFITIFVVWVCSMGLFWRDQRERRKRLLSELDRQSQPLQRTIESIKSLTTAFHDMVGVQMGSDIRNRNKRYTYVSEDSFYKHAKGPRALDNEASDEQFEVIKSTLLRNSKNGSSVLYNFREGLRRDLEIGVLISSKGWESSLASKRGLLILSKTVSLLFLFCITISPDEYLCPPGMTPASESVANQVLQYIYMKQFCSSFPPSL